MDTQHKLIIFDMDGTLADREGNLLEGVPEWFAENGHDYKFALATNQGGVGLRHWMEIGGFGNPEKYPTQESITEHVVSVLHLLYKDNPRLHIDVYIAFSYQSTKGQWSPTPDYAVLHKAWEPGQRKPAPGMLLEAIVQAGVSPAGTLMVGDRDDDRLAAEAAGCDFTWAWEFFGREQPEKES